VTGDTMIGQVADTALTSMLDSGALRVAPAAVAAVTYAGRVVAAHTHGEPRRDGAATTARTVFRIASMSKSFLAATALSLAEDGTLDLHARARTLVPELSSARYGSEQIDPTLDDLLCNRAGLAEDNPWGDEHLGESREWLTGVLTDGLRLPITPGTEYRYSNLGIALVGRAIEVLTGRSVFDVVRERILEPLGLADTRNEASSYPADADLAYGFRTFDGGATFAPEPFLASGALGCIGDLFSTVGDIATWMGFLGAAFGPSGTGEVLSAAARRRMQTPRTVIPTTNRHAGDRELDGAGYGYGLVVELDHRFGRVCAHSGSLPGFGSHMRWHPATGFGVVVFGNSDDFPAARVATDILADVLTRLDAPAETIRPWPETLAAAEELDSIVRGRRPIAAAAGLFTRNVLRDIPVEVRERRLSEALSATGSIVDDGRDFTERIVSASDPAHLRWSIQCQRGALLCDIDLIGLNTPLVQRFSMSVADAGGRKPEGEPSLVTDHYRVVAG